MPTSLNAYDDDDTSPDLDPEAETYPVVMIYMTVKVDHARGWTNSVRVQTPDGTHCLRSWGRSGGSLVHGMQKIIDDLQTGYRIAARIAPFD